MTVWVYEQNKYKTKENKEITTTTTNNNNNNTTTITTTITTNNNNNNNIIINNNNNNNNNILIYSILLIRTTLHITHKDNITLQHQQYITTIYVLIEHEDKWGTVSLSD